jgi:imidazolonepropionase-like amidohydrolase
MNELRRTLRRVFVSHTRTAVLIASLLPLTTHAQFRLEQPRPLPPKLVKVGRILNVVSGTYLLDQGILTEGDRIKAVGPWEQIQKEAPRNATFIDLSGATMLPGLIDSHSHLLVSMPPTSGGESIVAAVTLMSPEFRTLIGARHAQEYLEAGVTAVRVVGHSGIQGDIALRDAIAAGLVPGPRMQASGRKITPLGGQAVTLQRAVSEPILDQEYLPISGPEEARRAVRQNLAIGADLIKIVVDAGSGSTWKSRYLAPEDAKAVVEDAHRLGLRVAAHAEGRAAIQIAIDAGADSIEHAFDPTDAQLQTMKDKGIFLVATDIPDNPDDPPSALLKDRLQRAMRLGVKIAMGSDLWLPPRQGRTYGQEALLDLKFLAQEGMANIEVIRSATINAAAVMGASDDLGQVAPGKFADFIAVSADPLLDISSLQDIRFVMKGGDVVKNKFSVPK